MVVPAVDQHRVQDVVGRILCVWLLKKLIQRQLIWKLKPVEKWNRWEREGSEYMSERKG